MDEPYRPPADAGGRPAPGWVTRAEVARSAEIERDADQVFSIRGPEGPEIGKRPSLRKRFSRWLLTHEQIPRISAILIIVALFLNVAINAAHLFLDPPYAPGPKITVVRTNSIVDQNGNPVPTTIEGDKICAVPPAPHVCIVNR